jgi:hypothetical protein
MNARTVSISISSSSLRRVGMPSRVADFYSMLNSIE